MNWRLHVAHRAQRTLAKTAAKDRQRILAALTAMSEDPFGGDIARLKGERSAWRRRVGSYRIFFDVDTDQLLVEVVEISRRTSTTY